VAEQMQGSVARDGREIGWRSAGAGPPLLLLNGYGGTAADWDPNFIASLAERFEVVLPDNRGHGGVDLGR
jgi:pimeloyl-ACP methyl ester carboxylesterase